MNTALLTSDPERVALSNELHSRPFPELTAPCRAIFLALRPAGAHVRDRLVDRAHLIDLIDRYGGAHPPPDAAHYSGSLGRGWLKWESHTEFVTYTVFLPGVSEEPFSGDSLSLLPDDWLAAVGGQLVSAAMVRVERAASLADAETLFTKRFCPHFAAESLSTGIVVDDEALIASDFRLHEDGLARIGVIAIDGIGPRRLGRIVQRVLEVESYKSFSLLTLPVAREVTAKVTELEKRLVGLTADAANGAGDPRATLEGLTRLAAEVERLSTETAFRFGAAQAYEAIVNDRIAVLRERRLKGRQLYSEFMKRRFDPAMRTCRSAEGRLTKLSDRVARASSMLSTRVQVAVEAQNQALLASMDKRAATQLRLQQTVEGLSVVAISYYAVSLGAYLLGPVAKLLGFEKVWLTAGLAPVVILAVWLMVRNLKKHWS
ncbi:MAG: DUF3422 family protein [Pikeienuella sp.]